MSQKEVDSNQESSIEEDPDQFLKRAKEENKYYPEESSKEEDSKDHSSDEDKPPGRTATRGKMFENEDRVIDSEDEDRPIGPQHIDLKVSGINLNKNLASFRKALLRDKPDDKKGSASSKCRSILSLYYDSDRWRMECVLFLYYAVNYLNKDIFKVITKNIKKDELRITESEICEILKQRNAFELLSNYRSKERSMLNNRAFFVSVYLNAEKMSEQILTNSNIVLSTQLMLRMIETDQSELIRYCLKYKAQYDQDIKRSRILLSGAQIDASLSDDIQLSDFFNLMLQQDYSHERICHQLIFLKHFINYRELFVLFAVRRKVRLISFLMNSADLNFKFKPYLILDVLANDVYDITLLLYREYFLQLSGKTNRKIIRYLTMSFMKTGQTEEKCWLYMRFIDKVTLEQATNLIKALSLRTSHQSKSNIFLVCINVVRIGCLLIQIIERLVLRFPVLKDRIHEIRTKIVQILLSYMEDVTTIEEMRFLLLTQDLDYRDALTYICEYSILELLEVPLAAEVAGEFWNSKYNIRGLPCIVSTNHNLLFNFNHTRFDMESQMRFYNRKDLRKIGCHEYQFQVWRNCPKTRFYAEFFFILGFVIWTHTWIIDYFKLANRVWELSDLHEQNQAYIKSFPEVKNIGPSTCDQELGTSIGEAPSYCEIEPLGPLALDIYYKALDLTYIGFVYCQLALHNMFRSIYTGYTKQQMYFYTIETLIDVCIFGLFLNFIILTYRVDLEGTWFVNYSDCREAEIFIDGFLNSGVNEGIAITLCGIFLWIRVAFSLRLMPYVGPLMMLFIHSIKYIVGFAMLFSATVIIVALIGTLIFQDLPAFNRVDDSLNTIFNNIWGLFQFNDAKGGRFGSEIGYIYMMAIVVILIIILTNFLIAIFASRYDKFMKNEKSIMMQEALYLRPVMEASGNHSSLISGAFPLHGLNWATSPFMFFPRNPKLPNLIILHILYLPVAIVVTILFIVYNILILPLAYLKLIPHKFALIFKKEVTHSGNTANRVGSFVLILVFGLFILALNFCVDTYYFVIHLYKTDLERIDEGDINKIPDMSMRTYKKLFHYLEKHKTPYLPFEQVASGFREELEVMPAIRQMLFPHRSILKGKDLQNKATGIVNEYIIVKKILLNNSVDEKTTQLFPNGTKKITKDIKFNKRLLQYCLHDMLRFRRLLLMKRRCYLFTYLYDGKGQNKVEDLVQRREKIEKHISEAFNFINTKRTLNAIGYKPKEKIVSTEQKVYMEDGSDYGFAETMRNFHEKLDQRNFRKGGLLSQNNSKVSLKKLYHMAKTENKTSEKDETLFDVNDDFRVPPANQDVEKELAKVLEDESIEKIFGLGDSEDEEDDDFNAIGNVQTSATNVKEKPIDKKETGDHLYSGMENIEDSEEWEESEEEVDEEDDDVIEQTDSGNIEFSKEHETRDPKAS
ncbi:unnamed protein product [Moneuplotes crassus]|uniref:Uncharacterized protein n=1 Tax=Euplotes crassus TaxID=5936 RepID=A0AAD1UE40_EUPCR|nr:unnamed protein product [Moneuplotes crassus]